MPNRTISNWSIGPGRAIRDDKHGAIPGHLPPLLARLALDPGRYLHHMRGRTKLTQHLTALGSLEQLHALAKKMGREFIKGAVWHGGFIAIVRLRLSVVAFAFSRPLVTSPIPAHPQRET